MNVRLRRDETPAWAMWANARYEPAIVRFRAALHLRRPGSPWTLCLRAPDPQGEITPEARLCACCRGAAKASYALNTAPKVAPDRNRGLQ